MNSITYVGMDVHTSNFTLCCYTIEDDEAFAIVQIDPDYRAVIKYLKQIRKQRGKTRLVCGYEAGNFGYSLQKQLAAEGEECIILAPSTMPKTPSNKIKTDKRDAEKIARNLAYHQYKAVYIPDEEDDAVKEYIRMRNDIKVQQKAVKQQIIAFYTRHGFKYENKNYWTAKFLKWLESLQFTQELYKETLQEYLGMYYVLEEKIATFDAKIEELSETERYKDKTDRLVCLMGIATHTAMSLVSEISDFNRFPDAGHFAAYLGLVPGEDSSGDKQKHLPITKAGNSHLRRLLVEAAQCYGRGSIGKKTKTIKAKQKGNSPEVIAYADKANERLKKKYRKIKAKKNTNVAKTAVARELACFVWGMMTDHISLSD